MSQLMDQPSPAPTRKVRASTAAAGLAAAIAAAIIGVLPGDAGDEVRTAVQVLVDAALGFLLGGGASFVGGYFVRERDPWG